jgi:hypothetical protein
MIDLSNKGAYRQSDVEASIRMFYPPEIIAALDAMPKDPSNQNQTGVERLAGMVVRAQQEGYNNGITTVRCLFKDLLGLDRWL